MRTRYVGKRRTIEVIEKWEVVVMDKRDYFTSYICVQLSMNTFKQFLKMRKKKQDKAKVCAKLIPCGKALVSSFSVLHTVLSLASMYVRNHQHDDNNVQNGNFVTFTPKVHNQV